MKSNKAKSSKKGAILWVLTAVFSIGLVFSLVIFPELIWVNVGLALPLLYALFELARFNRSALQSRSAAYGLNSAVTILLVIGIVGVLNFLSARYPYKIDLTQNKLHTLSDQTVKLIKGLTKPVKAVLYAKLQQREQSRALLDNYKGLNPKFEVEYVDPDKEPTRTKQAGIKKAGTLQLIVGPRDSKVEEPNEEKLTNALIKLLKEKSPTACAVTGHGEKSFSSQEAEGYENAKKALADQAYEVKDINLVQENKVPETCDALMIIGPSKAFFPQEVKVLTDYLDGGGRMLIALDVNVKGPEFAQELNPLLEGWHLKVTHSIIVDPLSRMFGTEAAVPMIPTFAKDHAITREQMRSFFPITRPIEVAPGAPTGLNVQWLAQTTEAAWGIMDLKSLQGEVRFQEGRDKKGPLNVAVAVDGKKKDSKTTKNTRITAFGTSLFATNHYMRYGGNLDFFLNSVSWLIEDESMISIRAKEEGAGRVELTSRSGKFIFLLTVFAIPALTALGGIVFWAIRRRL